MFGLVVPGRLVDTNFQQLDQNKLLTTIPNVDKINHVVVFLTGVIPLPPDTAGCIFFSLPDPEAAPTWHYLGYLTNDKPSAIYKLSNMTRRQQNQINDGLSLAFNYAQAPVIHVAQIGISIEPLSQVVQMVPAIETTVSKASSFNEFIIKTVGNLYNYCSSFSRSLHELQQHNGMSASSDAQFVPLSKIQEWYTNYTRRLSNDQNFWKSLNC